MKRRSRSPYKTACALGRGYAVVLLPLLLSGCLHVALDAATMMPDRDLVPDAETAALLRQECEAEVYAQHGRLQFRWTVAEQMRACYARKVQERPSLGEKGR